MPKKPRYNYSIEGRPLYPHIKLTRERFPRLLSTRIIHDDDAEYFGPFLTRSAARILIDFLNRTFRLRSCTIEVDGSFPFPCTQYYANRCVAPCVASLCGPEYYSALVGLAQNFLRNDRDEFEFSVSSLIESAAEALAFERAAIFRDILTRVRKFWADPRARVWLNDAVDTFVVDIESGVATVFVITTRGPRPLGSRAFQFTIFDESDLREFLSDTIRQFYRVGVPREIRIPFDLPDLKELASELKTRSGRAVKVTVEGKIPERVAALKGLARIKLETELQNLKPVVAPARIAKQLARAFDLEKPPTRIEAFDSAHISGSYSTAGMSVWNEGRPATEEYREGLSHLTGELETLRDFISDRLKIQNSALPDLILVDGGKAHVNAAARAVEESRVGYIPIIGAVKPRGRHAEISHFISPSGGRVEFEPSSASHTVLKQLRDDAHALANAAHRQSRDMAHFYELAGILPSLNEGERRVLRAHFSSTARIISLNEKELARVIEAPRVPAALTDLERYRRGEGPVVMPLIVPIRYDDPEGQAGDLRPIKSDSFG